MKRIGKSLTVSIAAVVLVWLTVAGCGTAAAGGTAPQSGTASQGSAAEKPSSAQAGFVGHKWRVVAIDHNGRETPIPARYNVYVIFARNGGFGGNDPVNYHSGTYRLASGGFTTSMLSTTLAGYAGKDPIVALAVAAITAFDPGVHAAATLIGNRLKITVGNYLLECQPDGV
ncbi:META domain-containing protein [Trebonia sp.]|uniref:META domain-containing protein n=1 Tax=Trebonia sp. TaxID=2767075 RepID=UPI002626413E|nr:META domain-containing protein [Trebonia sp.]